MFPGTQLHEARGGGGAHVGGWVAQQVGEDVDGFLLLVRRQPRRVRGQSRHHGGPDRLVRLDAVAHVRLERRKR